MRNLDKWQWHLAFSRPPLHVSEAGRRGLSGPGQPGQLQQAATACEAGRLGEACGRGSWAGLEAKAPRSMHVRTQGLHGSLVPDNGPAAYGRTRDLISFSLDSHSWCWPAGRAHPVVLQARSPSDAEGRVQELPQGQYHHPQPGSSLPGSLWWQVRHATVYCFFTVFLVAGKTGIVVLRCTWDVCSMHPLPISLVQAWHGHAGDLHGACLHACCCYATVLEACTASLCRLCSAAAVKLLCSPHAQVNKLW